MSIDVTTDLQHVVEDAAAHLYVWALKDIPQDLRDALAAARLRETSVPGKRVLETIHRNINVADSEKNLVCQDTGIAVYKWDVADFDACQAGVKKVEADLGLALLQRPHPAPHAGHEALPGERREVAAHGDLRNRKQFRKFRNLNGIAVV